MAGIPAPVISWRREDGPLPLTAETLTGGVLRLSSVTQGEAGRYVCSASNTVGLAEETVEVRLEDPPEVRLEPEGRVVLSEGDSLTALCHLMGGDPQPQISWHKYPE